ncbi:hypothetical protein KSP39_PZI002544 [Platanthera zijinensis]|uniref:Uncharacterized protein n=1 Tax=Platanthera zijinensis TaxID=2320716 RepID=A0AAP0GDT1_9ASPA
MVLTSWGVLARVLFCETPSKSATHPLVGVLFFDMRLSSSLLRLPSCTHARNFRIFSVLCRSTGGIDSPIISSCGNSSLSLSCDFSLVVVRPEYKNEGGRSGPTDIHCGESVAIEGQDYTVSAVVHRYQLRRGKYEPRERGIDVQSTGRYILNLYLENLLEQT